VLIRWSSDAAEDLEDIVEYIRETRPKTAIQVASRIFEAVEALEIFPSRGRVGKLRGTRELVLSSLPYIIVYRVEQDAVTVLRIRHGAQNLP